MDAEESLGETERERDGEEGEEENVEPGSFSPLLFLQKCPFFYSPLFHQDSAMNGITDNAISRVTQIYFGSSAMVYFHRTKGDLSGDNLVSIKDLNGFCGDSGAKFNLFLIYYSRYEKEKNWTADGLKIGAVPLLYPQRSEALHHID